MFTVPEFANKIRTKYNAYQDIDDKTLVDKVIAKYPVYKDSISFEEPTPEPTVTPAATNLAMHGVTTTPATADLYAPAVKPVAQAPYINQTTPVQAGFTPTTTESLRQPVPTMQPMGTNAPARALGETQQISTTEEQTVKRNAPFVRTPFGIVSTTRTIPEHETKASVITGEAVRSATFGKPDALTEQRRKEFPTESMVSEVVGMVAPSLVSGVGVLQAAKLVPMVKSIFTAAEAGSKTAKFGKAGIDAVVRATTSGADYAIRNQDALTSTDPAVQQQAKTDLTTAIVSSIASVLPETILPRGMIQPLAQAATDALASTATDPKAWTPERIAGTIASAITSGMFGMADVTKAPARPVVPDMVKQAQEAYDKTPTLANRALLSEAQKSEVPATQQVAPNPPINQKKVLTSEPKEGTLDNEGAVKTGMLDEEIADITGVPVETIKQNKQQHIDNIEKTIDDVITPYRELIYDYDTGKLVAADKAEADRIRAANEENIGRTVSGVNAELTAKTQGREADRRSAPRTGEGIVTDRRGEEQPGTTTAEPAATTVDEAVTGKPGIPESVGKGSEEVSPANAVTPDDLKGVAISDELADYTNEAIQFAQANGLKFNGYFGGMGKHKLMFTILDQGTGKEDTFVTDNIRTVLADKQRKIDQRAATTPITPPPVVPPKPATEGVPPAPDQTPLSFVNTAKEKGILPETAETPLSNVQHHEETSAQAQKIIAEKGPEGTETWLLTEKNPQADYTAVAGATIKRLQNEAEAVRTSNPAEFNNKQERAIEIATAAAENLRKAGRFIEAVKIIGSMSPEGVLIRAQKLIQKSNENAIKKGPLKSKPQELTVTQADELSKLAQKTQDWGVLSEESKNLAGMIEKVGKGETLTPEENSQLRAYTKKLTDLVGEKYAPKKKREGTLNSVLNARIDKMAEKSIAYFKAKGKDIKLSGGIPLDDMYHASVIGVSIMAKHGLKYADWAAKMTGAIGNEIAPHLNKIYPKAMTMFREEKARAMKTYQQAHMLNNLLKKAEQSPEVAEAPNAQAFADMAANVRRLSGDAQNEAASELQQALAMLEKPTLLRKIATAQTIAQLFNPKTQVRNILGNEMFYRLERLNKLVSSGVDFAHSKLTGEDRTITWRTGDQGKFWESFFKGAKAGWKGYSPEGLQTQYELRGSAFRGKYNPMTYLEKALGATMRGFDYAAYARAKGNALGELAELAIINKKMKFKTPEEKRTFIDNFIGNLDDADKQVADKYGKYVTFQDENAISKSFVGMKRLLNVGKEFGVGDFILKYPKTPANLLARFIDYSPIGVANQFMKVVAPFTKGGQMPPTTKELTEALTRGITGTMGMTALGYVLLNSGVLTKGAITGKGTLDRDTREMQQQQTGERPYSVNIDAFRRFGYSLANGKFDEGLLGKRDGDTFVSYDWALPIAMNIALTTDIAKNIKEKGDLAKNLGETAYTAGSSALTTIAEQPLLTGLQALFGDKYEKDQIKRVGKVFEGVPASFIPAMSNQLRMLVDPNKREIHDPNPFKKAINLAINKIPIWSETLPLAYKALSEPLTNEEMQTMRESGREGGIEKMNAVVRQTTTPKKFSNITDAGSQAFNIFLNPAIVNKYHIDPIISALLEPYEKEGRTKQFPQVANRQYIVPQSMFNRLGFEKAEGQTRIDLPGEKIQELQRYMATRTRQMLSATTLSSLKNKSAEDQEKILMNKVRDATELARKDFEKRNMKFIYDGLKAAGRNVRKNKPVQADIPLDKQERKLSPGEI